MVPRITKEASGPSYSVVQLCRSLRAEGCDASLAVLGSGMLLNKLEFIRQFPIASFPERLGRSPAMRQWLRQIVETGGVDIIHNNSLWMMPNVYSGWATRGTETLLLVSPRGTFSNWALRRSKWTKRLFWSVAQSRAISHTACFHATAEHEYQDIRRAGFSQPVCVIPNGVNIPATIPQPKVNKKLRRLLFLGRIHPVKGIDILLQAWAALCPRLADWVLEVVGPDNDGYLGEMRVLAQSLKLEKVSFRGPLFGQEKVRAYQEAEVFVLPTHSENFGMTIAEAMACGTPVITTQEAPWSDLERRGAGWWIENGVEPLVACLEDALGSSPERLIAMGDQGREWMRQDFSWHESAHKMKTTYQWLLNGGNRPAWVKPN